VDGARLLLAKVRIAATQENSVASGAMARTRPARIRGARRRRGFAPWASLVAALALFAQLLALPYHHPQAPADLAAVAASLKATFGDAATLCTQANDAAPGEPERHQGPCDVGCPLCQFAAQTVLFEAPLPALPERVALPGAPLPPPADFASARPHSYRFAQPRAPPLEA
jgi:hypothetical protein